MRKYKSVCKDSGEKKKIIMTGIKSNKIEKNKLFAGIVVGNWIKCSKRAILISIRWKRKEISYIKYS